jgi:hypothetical protein
MRARVLLALSAFLSAAPAFAWSEHALLTRVALGQVPGLDEAVPVETLDRYAVSQGLKGRVELLARLQLNPGYDYGFHAGEKDGGAAPLRRILETYADEPDDGMDESAGGSGGLMILSPSEIKSMEELHAGDLQKAVRHVYWPGGLLGTNFRDEFAGTLVERELRKIYTSVPLDAPFGEAPTRCRVLFDASVAALRSGHPYWGARFLAWSIHYAQDLTQPLHTGPIPSARMICWSCGREIKEGSLRENSYYHTGFERAALWTLKGALGADAQATLTRALSGTATIPGASDPESLAKSLAASSHREMGATGRSAWELFPPLTDPVHQDPVQITQSNDFGRVVAAAAARRPQAYADMLGVLARVFPRTGAATRTLVSLARERAAAPPTASAPPAPGPAALESLLAEQALRLQSQ